MAALLAGAAPAAERPPIDVFRPQVFARSMFRIEPLGPPVVARHDGAARITILTRQPAAPAAGAVCVRLCDGGFFPLTAGDAASAAAQCDSQCPDAPTAVFYRNGGEPIESAVSLDGRRYLALAAALRFQRVADPACACHRGAVAFSPLNDPTLRPGDAVMTPAGFAVFRGADFAPLAEARLPEAERGALQAMERVSLAGAHPSLRQWLAAATAPAAAGGDRIRLMVWRGGED